MAAHSGPSPAGDFRYNTLLLTANGVNGAQNNTFVDSSPPDPSYPGGYAVSFDGSGDYLTIPYSTTAFDWWTGDFTIEAWVYPTTLANWSYDGGGIILPAMCGNASYNSTTNYWSFGPIANGTVKFYYFNGSPQANVVSTATVSANQWSHIAMTKTSAGIQIWVNGVGTTAVAVSGTPQSNAATSFTAGQVNNRSISGNVSNLRIVKGTALYTANFTVPLAPLLAVSGTQLLICQSPALIDIGPSNLTITAYGNATTVPSKLITRTGNVAQGTFSPFSLAEGQWSNYFDGSGDYLSVPNSTSLQLSGNQFTIEGWFYLTTTGVENYLLTQANGGSDGNVNWLVRVTSGNKLRVLVMTSGSTPVFFDGSTTVTANQWYHFAAVCDGSGAGATLKSWLNGVYQGTSSSFNAANVNTNTATTQIGGWQNISSFATGYITNIRIIKGTALYTGTSNITVPTAPLTAISGTSLLTCQSNRFKDNSSNNFTITPTGDTKVTAWSPFEPGAPYIPSINGGSAYFDGSGDFLQTAIGTNLNLGLSDFTIEFWAYFNSLSGDPHVFDQRITNTFSAAPIFAVGSTGGTSLYRAGGVLIQGSAAGTVKVGEWTHIAITRVGTNFNTYVNGVLAAGPTSLSYDFSAVNPVRLGTGNTAQAPVNGYISDFRYVIGTAIYTSNFTPPTAPLTAISGTSLLLNCTNAGIIDNSGKNDIETVGNAQISTSVKKYGTGSMYFDGSGDYLLSAPSQNYNFGTGDFTIEFWCYVNSISTYGGILDTRSAVNLSNYAVGLWANSGNRLDFIYGATRLTSASTFATGAWVHFAVTRSSGTIRLFINGSLDANTASYTSAIDAARAQPLIGAVQDPYYLNGYIDDLRITKGIARYTGDFTLPTYPIKLR